MRKNTKNLGNKILLVEPAYQTKFANLGLMRISSMLKAKGYKIEFIKGLKKIKYTPDEIWITSLFTYQYPEVQRTIRFYKKQSPKSKFKLGGILASTRPDLFKDEGVEIHKGLLPEAEDYPPDYSLYPDLDYSITFASRGCIRNCGFCCVPKIEGKIWHRENWLQDINLKFRKIIFMDNNWLALDKKYLMEDIIKLRELKEKGINEIDFNQSLDCRLFTEEIAKELKGLPIRPIRFSFDHMGEDKVCQNAILLSKKYKFSEVRVDVLYNWMDTPEDFYYRLKEICKCGGSAIPMKYAPLDKVDRRYLGKNWTKREMENVPRINPYPKGEISPRNVEEFEMFFGKDAKEFRRLLNFNGIAKLNQLKMEKLKKDKIWKMNLKQK